MGKKEAYAHEGDLEWMIEITLCVRGCMHMRVMSEDLTCNGERTCTLTLRGDAWVRK
jgi:hypothetical protein